MRKSMSEKLEKRLQEEAICWLTTVRQDGLPQPTPVWFLWQEGIFLIYSQPHARKVRNIRANPRVAINLNSDEWSNEVAIFYGRASLDFQPTPAHQVEAYLAKYRQGVADLGITPEEMAGEYSTAIWVVPDFVREE